HADIGISLPGTGEQPTAPVFIDGKKAMTLRGPTVAADFKKIVVDYIERRFGSSGGQRAAEEAYKQSSGWLSARGRAPRQRFVRAVSADPTCVVATAWLPNKHSAQKSRCIEAAKPRQFSAAHPQMPASHIATAFTPHHFGRAIWRGDFTM